MNVQQQLDELYAKIPRIECRGQCWDTCGPIDMATAERTRINDVAGVDIPRGTFAYDGPSTCPALGMMKTCTVYEIRPLICRLWGVAEGMPCTYGCRPERYLTEAETYELLAQAHDISGDQEMAKMVRAANDPAHREALRAAREQIEIMSREQAKRWGMKW